MGKRALPEGQKCRRRNVSIAPDDWAYLQRLAAEAKGQGKSNASVSGQIRVALRARRAVRHDLPGVASLIEGTAVALSLGAQKKKPAVEVIVTAAREIAKLRDAE